MPKQKRKSALAKRIKISSTGKVRRHQAYTSHLAQNKSTKQKRQSRKSCLMHPSDLKRMKGIM